MARLRYLPFMLTVVQNLKTRYEEQGLTPTHLIIGGHWIFALAVDIGDRPVKLLGLDVVYVKSDMLEIGVSGDTYLTLLAREIRKDCMEDVTKKMEERKKLYLR